MCCSHFCCCCGSCCCRCRCCLSFRTSVGQLPAAIGKATTTTTGSKINWKLISCFDYRLCRTFYDLEYDTFVSSLTLSPLVRLLLVPQSHCPLLCPRGRVHFLTKLARQWHELKRNDQLKRSWTPQRFVVRRPSSVLVALLLQFIKATAHSSSPPVRC